MLVSLKTLESTETLDRPEISDNAVSVEGHRINAMFRKMAIQRSLLMFILAVPPLVNAQSVTAQNIEETQVYTAVLTLMKFPKASMYWNADLSMLRLYTITNLQWC